jgi:6-phosphofructokinase 1
VRLGGVGNVIAAEIEHRIGKETRTVVLGHLQRGGPPTTFDRVLATQYGVHAVRLIVEQKFGEMVTYNPPAMNSVPIIDAIRLSTVHPDSSAVQSARAMGVSFGDSLNTPPFTAAAHCANQTGNGSAAAHSGSRAAHP